MCTARLFSQGVHLFALKFYLNRVVPHEPFWHQTSGDTWLPVNEDRMLLRSLVLTQYRSATDGQMDGLAVAYTALAKLALRRAVKISL